MTLRRTNLVFRRCQIQIISRKMTTSGKDKRNSKRPTTAAGRSKQNALNQAPLENFDDTSDKNLPSGRPFARHKNNDKFKEFVTDQISLGVLLIVNSIERAERMDITCMNTTKRQRLGLWQIGLRQGKFSYNVSTLSKRKRWICYPPQTLTKWSRG